METATALRPNRTIEIVAEDYLAAKKLKRELDAQILELEQEMIASLGAPDEGSKTHRIAGFKIELKGVVNRKVDWDVFDTVVAKLSSQEAGFVPPEKHKRELDETGLKWYAKEQPGVYARLAAAVTATPGKTGVSVSRTE